MSLMQDKTEKVQLREIRLKLITHVSHFKALDAVVEDLYRAYFATYGYSFPLTGNYKCMFLCIPLYGSLIHH